jgi:L-serine dehydratase
MAVSVFEIFKIGVGPSSSHTMGPMTAATLFLDRLRAPQNRAPGAGAPARLRCDLHGSLAFTGKGHATDRAVLLGLCGFTPAGMDAEAAETALDALRETRETRQPGLPPLALDPERDVVFDYGPPPPGHPNALTFTALDADGRVVLRETWFSIGGGAVATKAELDRGARPNAAPDARPYPFADAAQMLAMARDSGLSVARMQRANERATASDAEIDAGLRAIWETMRACMDRGLRQTGVLPGGLGVKRRAGALHDQLQAERGLNHAAPHVANDWLAAYAMAVNEENAAGGRVVTAPTNGAAGVFPAVLRYWRDHVAMDGEAAIPDMLLTGAAIGSIIARNASISGAECGCQAEVGSAAAMAAGALAHALGGDAAKVERAAEIALEHHLGMTCDPIAGLVQAPCIERNGLGAVKAVAAASLAMRGDGGHIVSLDACIETMRQTGRDMSHKYKETALGGLAVNVPTC